MQRQIQADQPKIEQQAEVIVYEDHDRHGPYTRVYGFVGGFPAQELDQVFTRLEFSGRTKVRAISLEEFNQLQDQEGRLRFGVERAICISRRTFNTIIASLTQLNTHQSDCFAAFRDNSSIGFGLHNFYLRLGTGRNMTCYKVIAHKSLGLEQIKELCIKTKKQLEVLV